MFCCSYAGTSILKWKTQVNITYLSLSSKIKDCQSDLNVHVNGIKGTGRRFKQTYLDHVRLGKRGRPKGLYVNCVIPLCFIVFYCTMYSRMTTKSHWLVNCDITQGHVFLHFRGENNRERTMTAMFLSKIENEAG